MPALSRYLQHSIFAILSLIPIAWEIADINLYATSIFCEI